MMAIKGLVVMCYVISAVLCSDEKYTSKYDNINVSEILHNDRLLIAYVDCLMERGKCTPEGKELKDHAQEALETGCAKCTEIQENTTYTVFDFLINNKREMWDELCSKYDPTGKWRKTYEERAKAKGIKIPEN